MVIRSQYHSSANKRPNLRGSSWKACQTLSTRWTESFTQFLFIKSICILPPPKHCAWALAINADCNQGWRLLKFNLYACSGACVYQTATAYLLKALAARSLRTDRLSRCFADNHCFLRTFQCLCCPVGEFNVDYCLTDIVPAITMLCMDIVRMWIIHEQMDFFFDYLCHFHHSD